MRRLPGERARRARSASRPRPISVRNPRRPRLTPSSGASRGRVRDRAGGVEQRAVAAERDDDVGAVGQSLARHGRPARAEPRGVGAVRLDHRRAAARVQPRGRLRQRDSAAGSVCRAMRPARDGAQAGSRRRRSRQQQRNSRLPSAPVTGDGSTPSARQSYLKGRAVTSFDHARVDRRIARRCRPRRPRPSGFELRLDERDRRARPARAAPARPAGCARAK